MDTVAQTLLKKHGQITQDAQPGYSYYSFEVPSGMAALGVRLSYEKLGICQLYLSVFGPDGYRGTRMKPSEIGEVELELVFGEAGASLGAIAGPIEAGTWQVLLDLERTHHATEYTLEVRGHTQPIAYPQVDPGARSNGRRGQGWYRGELHAHSHHSDGRTSVQTVVSAARRFELDFLALTDHYTTAGWPELKALADAELCVITSSELTAHRGHANMHGLKEWVNPFVDGEGWGINDAAKATRRQGGLFCVNHPFALDLGWRYHRFDWNLADLIEIYHHLEGSANTSQLTFWDSLLRQGYRITGVAGTDSHDPFSGNHRLGQVFTYVYSDELSPQGILRGLRSGQAYVSLGPTLEFAAKTATERAEIGGNLQAGPQLSLEAKLWGMAFPARVILIKNGFYHDHRDISPSANLVELEFSDDKVWAGDFYRLEVFARAPRGGFGNGREWEQTLVLSNPIFLV